MEVVKQPKNAMSNWLWLLYYVVNEENNMIISENFLHFEWFLKYKIIQNFDY